MEEQPAPKGTVYLEPMSSGEARASDSKGVLALQRGIAIAFLATLFISHKLWLTTRDYPLTPIWSGLPQPPYPLDHILFWLMGAALVAVAFLPNPRVALKMVFVIGILWAALDQSRWQPYFVLYMVILACLSTLPFEKRRMWSSSEIDGAFLPTRLFIAFTYLYSGLQKFNHQFVTDLFPWLLEPLRWMIHFDVSHVNSRWEVAMALGAATAEATGGLMLLFPKTRRLAAAFLIAMHGFILLTIGPLGHKWNAIIWPWNIAMMIALWALFWRRDACAWPTPALLCREWRREVRSRRQWMVPAVVLLFGIVPTLSFFGRWDSYLSFALYTDSTREANIRIDPKDYSRMPLAVQMATDPDSGTVDLITWSTTELGAMDYPEDRIALNICKSLARRARHGAVLVQLSSKPDILTGEREYRFFRYPAGGSPAYEISSEEFNASL